MTAAAAGPLARPLVWVSETLAATAAAPGPDAAETTAALYTSHYRSLVRLAMLLVDDVETAEEVVQDSFAALHANWRRFKNSEKAWWYLRQCVLNRSRSVLRHRKVVDRKVLQPPPDTPSAEQSAITLLERDAVLAALQQLPQRQREALALRYYADMSEAEIASAMRISRGAVKSHIFRGMTALRDLLDEWDMSRRRVYRGGSCREQNDSLAAHTAAGPRLTGSPAHTAAGPRLTGSPARTAARTIPLLTATDRGIPAIHPSDCG